MYLCEYLVSLNLYNMEDVVRKYKFPPFPQIENNMEDVIRKCPHIGINIFGCLDFKSLNKCKDVCKTLSLLLDDPKYRIFWINKIATTFVIDSDGVIGQLKGIKKPTLEFLSEEAGKIPMIKSELFHLLHFIASIGQVEVYRKVFLESHDKNPLSRHRFSPLHMAAKYGHLEICSFIIANVVDKNPKSEIRITPLHVAATEGHLGICKLILDNVDKTTALSTKTVDGNTPLHHASLYGQKEVCDFFIANGADPNVTNTFGRSSRVFMRDIGSRLSGRNSVAQNLEII